MDTLISMTKNLCAFILLTTVINNLLQESKYRKYIRYFAGLVIFIMIINPVINLFSIDFDLNKIVTEYIYKAERTELQDKLPFGNVMSEYKESLDRELEGVLLEHNMKLLRSSWNVEENDEDKYGALNELYAEICPEGTVDINNVRIDSSGNVSVDMVKEGVIEDIEEAFGLKKELIRIEIVG